MEGKGMTREELGIIVDEELNGRPVFAPINIAAWMDMAYRDLRFLPAKEVRLAIRSFYGAPICTRCATRAQRWPHAEEIRAQIPDTMIDKAVKERGEIGCETCQFTGWVEVRHGEQLGVKQCECRKQTVSA